MKNEIIGRVFKNSTTHQYNIVPSKKLLSTELLDTLSNPSVVGLKLKVIKVYGKKEMPNVNMTKDERKESQRESVRRYQNKKKEENNERTI